MGTIPKSTAVGKSRRAGHVPTFVSTSFARKETFSGNRPACRKETESGSRISVPPGIAGMIGALSPEIRRMISRLDAGPSGVSSTRKICEPPSGIRAGRSGTFPCPAALGVKYLSRQPEPGRSPIATSSAATPFSTSVTVTLYVSALATVEEGCAGESAARRNVVNGGAVVPRPRTAMRPGASGQAECRTTTSPA
jgi:hypothetical protein